MVDDGRMARDLLHSGDGRFWRGNLHCHSDRSDGMWAPERVAAAYREAGYDFIALSDHFEERYGWRVTDTRDLRWAMAGSGAGNTSGGSPDQTWAWKLVPSS
jgi:hypothetical protein